MEEGKKKIVMTVIIVACIAAAVVITVVSRSGGGGGLDDMSRGTMIWIKCRDPKCEYAWQMDKKDYFQYVEDNRDGMMIPAVECPQCHGMTGYRAEKCPKCGTIFERVATSNTPDKCPKCGYSAFEELRNKVRRKPAAETKE